MPRHLATRAGLALASIALGALLVVNFRAPGDAVLDEATTGSGTGSSGTGTSGTGTSGAGSSGSGASGATGASGSAVPSSGTSGSAGSSGSSSTAAQTITGSLVTTRYGPVEVQVTISLGKIVDISAVQLPSGGRSGSISSYAEPILQSEALTAQSAQIDLVSGATYTSTAYERSLQSALDEAGL
jgi:uncharacterized protein with FMN-binding domain